eukprot:15471794-Alexandrium_andersonii.AAC.1
MPAARNSPDERFWGWNLRPLAAWGSWSGSPTDRAAEQHRSPLGHHSGAQSTSWTLGGTESTTIDDLSQCPARSIFNATANRHRLEQLTGLNNPLANIGSGASAKLEEAAVRASPKARV